jgi:Mesyanzhinovviridae DNA helicase
MSSPPVAKEKDLRYRLKKSGPTYKASFVKTRSKKYRYKVRPYRHQVAALKKLLDLKWGGALLMSPRTGKTKVAVDWTSILHQAGKVDRVLVVCPISVIGVWEKEIEANCPFPYKIVVWDKDGRKTTSLPPWGVKKLVFVLINYDAFSTPGSLLPSGRRSRRRGGRFEMKRAIERWHPDAIILDESHRIKSPSSKKTTLLWSLGPLADYRLLMTGTVLTKKKRVYDIYSQWKFLNPRSPLVKEQTITSFRREYGVWTTRRGYPQWLRNRNMVQLRKLLHAESFAVTREECFDLPHRRDQIIPIELTGHNAEVYDQMAEEMYAKLKSGEITEAPIKIVQSLRLGQLTSGITRTTPTLQFPEKRLVRVGRDKLNALEELISDLFEADEKIVIAARWRADLAAIMRLCEKLKVPAFELSGRVKGRLQRDRNIESFKNVDGPACFVMQPTAGALGIDLSAASIFIWFSLPGGDWVNFTQAEDRVALSPRPTIFMYMLCQGTIDELMYDNLQEDGDLARAVTESPERLRRNFKDAGTG